MSHTIFRIHTRVVVSALFLTVSSQGLFAVCNPITGKCSAVTAVDSHETAPDAPEAAVDPRESQSRVAPTPDKKTFPQNIDELIAAIKEPVAMTLDASDEAKNNQKFSIGGTNNAVKDALLALREYREKLITCQGDEATGKLTSVVDEYVNFLLDTVKSEATVDNEDVTGGLGGFIKKVLNPRREKTHHISEKVINTYTLQFKKYLAEKNKKFESDKETFEAEDAKFQKAITDLASSLTNNKFRETVFDEQKAKEDASTSQIVSSTDAVIGSFKEETCKLTEEKEVARTSTPVAEEEASEETEDDSNEPSKVETVPFEDQETSEVKKEEKQPEKKEEVATTTNTNDLPFPYPTTSESSVLPEYTPFQKDSSLKDALKKAIEDMMDGFEALADLKREQDAIQPKEEPKKDGFDSLLASMLGAANKEKKSGPAPASSSNNSMLPQQERRKDDNKLNVEAPKGDPMAGQPVAAPQLPMSSSSQSTSSYEPPKLNLDSSSSRVSSNYVPSSQQPANMAALELAKLSLQGALQQRQAPVTNNVNGVAGSGFTPRQHPGTQGGNYTTPGGMPTRTAPPKAK